MMKHFKIYFTLFFSLIAVSTAAEVHKPVQWTESIEMTSDTEGVIILKARIDNGWHMYSMDIPKDGPVATSVSFSNLEGMELVGNPVASPEPHKYFDKQFSMKLGSWEDSVKINQKFRLMPDSKGCRAGGEISWMACNDTSCFPPRKDSFSVTYNADAIVNQSNTLADTLPAASLTQVADSSALRSASYDSAGWWEPSEIEQSTDTPAQSDWWHIFIWGFIGGLLALLTPCVWPMIPMTVSFFLKKTTSRRQSVMQAVAYGVSIIVIYLVLGIAVTLIFGATALNQMATNAVFNLIFFAILVIFAISFFGAFDIKLPSKWSNNIDGRAESTTGFISIFFMAFTLVLVSFSCTGPLIGTLLVEAASQGNITGSAVGMGAFALALAIPFALFAIFPSLLKEMPRSGGWLNSVKVVLGFLELALSLKFLSVVDLAYGWHILDREVFISLWIVLFVLLGMYLLGKIRFSHDSPLEHLSVTRFFLALISLSFSVYLLPGLWGAPLKAVSAFVPPLETQDFNLYPHAEFAHFDNYDEGMKYAAEHDMPVIVDFSGYGCVNCRKMEGAVLDNEEVKSMIENNFVLITLMVDDRTKLSQPQTIESNGKQVTITEVGELWSYLQEHKFNILAQPYYVILNNDGRPMNSPMQFTDNPSKFMEWMTEGLENYNK